MTYLWDVHNGEVLALESKGSPSYRLTEEFECSQYGEQIALVSRE